MKKIFITILITFITVSCVPKRKYEAAQNEAEYWKGAFDNLKENYGDNNRQYSDLVDKYNQLVDKYNNLYYESNDTQSESEKYKDIIERAKDAVETLHRHFRNFRYGNGYNADDIERDIREVESKLDGWL